MVTAAEEFSPAGPRRSDAGHQTTPSEWVLRAVVSAHVVVIFGQPVFAGVYLSGDYDALRLHEVGANLTTSLGYVQLIVAIVVWVRLRRAWPFLGTLALVTAETVQYFAGMAGALWLHLPLGVATIAGLVLQFVHVWRRPLGQPPLGQPPLGQPPLEQPPLRQRAAAESRQMHTAEPEQQQEEAADGE